MLSLISEVVAAFTPVKQTHTVLLLGTESSGKTALCVALARLLARRSERSGGGRGAKGAGDDRGSIESLFEQVPVTTRTLGQNVVELETASTVVTVWDVGGSEAIRPMWKHYVGEASKIVYVVDGRAAVEDVERDIDILLDVVEVANPEEDGTNEMNHEEAEGAIESPPTRNRTKPVLVLATKMDAYDEEVSTSRGSSQLSYKMDDVAMAGRLEAVATAFTKKVEEKRTRCGLLFNVEYRIKVLPVSCLDAEMVEDVLDWCLANPLV